MATEWNGRSRSSQKSKKPSPSISQTTPESSQMDFLPRKVSGLSHQIAPVVNCGLTSLFDSDDDSESPEQKPAVTTGLEDELSVIKLDEGLKRRFHGKVRDWFRI